jgi:hypothetical protein
VSFVLIYSIDYVNFKVLFLVHSLNLYKQIR